MSLDVDRTSNDIVIPSVECRSSRPEQEPEGDLGDDAKSACRAHQQSTHVVTTRATDAPSSYRS